MELSAEFQLRFPDEQACRNYLFRLRWPDGYSCPRCGHPHSYDVPTRQLHECRECRMQTSVTAGTIMHRTKLPLRHWFLAMFLVATGQPCSARSLAAKLAINYRSALGMLRKIRRVLRSENGPHPLAHAGVGFGVRHVWRERAEICSSGQALEPTKALERSAETGEHGELEESRTAARTEELSPARTAAADDQAAAVQSQPGVRIYNKPHEVVERAKRMMLEKAAAFIKRVYRNVKRDYIQEYIDEFYYRRTVCSSSGRFLDMLHTSVMVLPI